MKTLLSVAAAAMFAMPAIAQDAGPMPLPVQRASQGNAILTAGTEVTLQMAQEVTTKGRTWDEGDTFVLTVVHDVMLGDYVVIPSNSRAIGRITFLTDKGMFGKSGKMDVEMEYVEVSGRRIDLDGTYRQEGEGNTVATVGGVILAGPFAAFITGRSGRIPQGRELTATLERDLELAIAASEIGSGGLSVRAANAGTAPMPVTSAAAPEAAAETVNQPATGGPSDALEFESEPVEQALQE